MCLQINIILTEKGLTSKKVHSNGMVKVWKVLKVNSISKFVFFQRLILTSPILNSYKWTSGWNKSDRLDKELTKYETYHQEVSKGIHVFLEKEDTSYMNLFNIKRTVVVPVYVREKDLVVRNKTQAVFTKVFLKKEDHKTALKNSANQIKNAKKKN